MENNRPTMYTGSTENLVKRVWQHKNEVADGFTKQYHLHKLVYYEQFETIIQAIMREKQIKDMNRKEKIKMIESFNPKFEDLYKQILD